MLLDLTSDDMKELGIIALGDRKKLVKLISTLSNSEPSEPAVVRHNLSITMPICKRVILCFTPARKCVSVIILKLERH